MVCAKARSVLPWHSAGASPCECLGARMQAREVAAPDVIQHGDLAVNARKR